MKCKIFGEKIDQFTIDWFAIRKKLRKKRWGRRERPNVCGRCLSEAIYDMFDEMDEEEANDQQP